MRHRLNILVVGMCASISMHAQQQPITQGRLQQPPEMLDAAVTAERSVILPQKLRDSILTLKNLLPANLRNFLQKPLVLNHGSSEMIASYSNLLSFPYASQYYSSQFLAANLSLQGIPVGLSYVNNVATAYPTPNVNGVSLVFNRDEFITQLKKRLLPQIDIKSIASRLNDPLQQLKSAMGSALQNDLLGLNKKCGGQLQKVLFEIGDPQALISSNIQSVRQRLITQTQAASITGFRDRINNIQSRKNAGENYNHEELDSLMEKVSAFESLQQALAVVEVHMNRWKTSGLIQLIEQAHKSQLTELTRFLNDPKTVVQLARQNLNLNGLQRFFLSASRLRAGTNALTESSLSASHFLNSGLLTEFMNEKRSLLLFSGTQSRQSVVDLPFSNTPIVESRVRLVQIGKPISEKGGSHVSVVSVDQGLRGLTGGGGPFFRKSLITTIQKEIKISRSGLLRAEISRSATSYGQTDGSVNNSVKGLLSLDNVEQNTAFNINYKDERQDIGLAYQVSAFHSAAGYVNAAAPQLTSGSSGWSLQVKKSLLKKRMQVGLRNQLKLYNFSGSSTTAWLNKSAVLDIRWKLKRGQFLTLRYLPSRMKQLDRGDRHLINGFDRISVDGNIQKRAGSLVYNAYVSGAYQNNRYVLDDQRVHASSTSLLLNQAFVIGNLPFFVNSQYTRSSNTSGVIYFNSSFNSELGLNYMLFKKIQIGTAVNYASIVGWYRQIGVRETVSININERIQVNGFVDARKNIRLIEPLLFGLTRAELGMHYQLNGK